MLKQIDFNNDISLITKYMSFLITHEIRHINYKYSVEHESEMSVHLKGKNPEKLLNLYRPNEPIELKKYRLEVYEPFTKSESERIKNTLSTIQKKSNFSIKFEDQSLIPEEENLQSYTSENYPKFGSLEKWAFEIALPESLSDPNAIVIVMPIQPPKDDITFLEPFTFIYRSDQLVDYGSNYYTILLDEKNYVNGSPLNIWLLVTNNYIYEIKQISEKDEEKLNISILYEMPFDEIPVFFLKGNFKTGVYPICYESFISGILPYWNKAIVISSDLDAQYNQHMYMERVEVETECDNGCTRDLISDKYVLTRLRNGQEITIDCEKCNGTGWKNGRSPFGVTSVRHDSFENEKNIPFPGVTYIDKPTDIIKITENKIDELITSGFSSINMDVTNKVGENQSGIAKTLDRTELESFQNKISDNLFDNILKHAYKYISMWRYSPIGGVFMPTINKPTKFNALREISLVDEIKKLNESGINTTQLELDLIDKKFPNDEIKKQFNKNIIQLDPLAGYSLQEKIDIRLANGISHEQFIISSNIRRFLLNAMEEDNDFLTKTRSEKQVKLLELARNEIINPIVSLNGTD